METTVTQTDGGQQTFNHATCTLTLDNATGWKPRELSKDFPCGQGSTYALRFRSSGASPTEGECEMTLGCPASVVYDQTPCGTEGGVLDHVSAKCSMSKAKWNTADYVIVVGGAAILLLLLLAMLMSMLKSSRRPQEVAEWGPTRR